MLPPETGPSALFLRQFRPQRPAEVSRSDIFVGPLVWPDANARSGCPRSRLTVQTKGKRRELSHTSGGSRLAAAIDDRTAQHAMSPLELEAIEFRKLVDRVRCEFLEMPGLRLTMPQAARLWGLDLPSCEAVVDVLIRSAFLQRTVSGAVARVEG